MCGRYTFYDNENEELAALLRQMQNIDEIKTGEIFPTNKAPIIGQSRQPEAVTWGFPNFRNKGVIINARAETAPEKPMFRSSLFERRCVIPSSGFFEWDSEKQKHLFTLPGEKVLYMAGFWNEFQGEKRFVILTTAPNDSIVNIHNRMPVVLPKSKVGRWLSQTDTALKLLHDVPPMLDMV